MATSVQEHFPLSPVYDYLLKAIAKSYGLSVSAYCAKIMDHIVRYETVELNLPVDRVIPPEWHGVATKQIQEEYFVNRVRMSIFAQENKQDFDNFQQYVLQSLGGNYTPTPNVQVIKQPNGKSLTQDISESAKVVTTKHEPVVVEVEPSLQSSNQEVSSFPTESVSSVQIKDNSESTGKEIPSNPVTLPYDGDDEVEDL